jgi:hypothetical protein
MIMLYRDSLPDLKAVTDPPFACRCEPNTTLDWGGFCLGKFTQVFPEFDWILEW